MLLVTFNETCRDNPNIYKKICCNWSFIDTSLFTSYFEGKVQLFCVIIFTSCLSNKEHDVYVDGNRQSSDQSADLVKDRGTELAEICRAMWMGQCIMVIRSRQNYVPAIFREKIHIEINLQIHKLKMKMYTPN